MARSAGAEVVRPVSAQAGGTQRRRNRRTLTTRLIRECLEPHAPALTAEPESPGEADVVDGEFDNDPLPESGVAESRSIPDTHTSPLGRGPGTIENSLNGFAEIPSSTIDFATSPQRSQSGIGGRKLNFFAHGGIRGASMHLLVEADVHLHVATGLVRQPYFGLDPTPATQAERVFEHSGGALSTTAQAPARFTTSTVRPETSTTKPYAH